MGSARSWRHAVVLSMFDLPDADDLLVHSCEDCACPVSDNLASRHQVAPPGPAVSDDIRWVCASEVVEFPLDPGHRLLFNPLGSGGIVVVNDPAYAIFRGFARPMTSGDVARSRPGDGEEVDRIFRRLSQLQVIHPFGRPLTSQIPRWPGADGLAARD